MDNEFSKRNIKKFYEKTEIISSEYYIQNNPASILVASDIHYHPHVDKEIYKILVSYCQKTNPDFVVMSGDQIETIDFIDIKKEKNFFESIIKLLAEVAPLIIIPGNHEIGNFDVKSYGKHNYFENTKSIRYFDTLNKINNVYYLNNEQVILKEINFLGFSPRLESYLEKKTEKINTMLVEDYLKSGLKAYEDKYNVLLTHRPFLLKEKSIITSVPDFWLTDLVISGHLHDGYLAKRLDWLFRNTNIGLFFSPAKLPLPGDVCRGIHEFGRGTLFISQGFRKWAADIKLFNLLEKINANDVEKIIITNPKNIDIIKSENIKAKCKKRNFK